MYRCCLMTPSIPAGKTVTELTIPQAPVNNTPESTNKLPENKAEVLNRPDIELNAAEINEDNNTNATGETPLQPSPDGGHADQAEKVDNAGAYLDEPMDNAAQIDSSEQPVLDTGEKQGANVTEKPAKKYRYYRACYKTG